jgi:hypothetical protein
MKQTEQYITEYSRVQSKDCYYSFVSGTRPSFLTLRTVSLASVTLPVTKYFTLFPIWPLFPPPRCKTKIPSGLVRSHSLCISHNKSIFFCGRAVKLYFNNTTITCFPSHAYQAQLMYLHIIWLLRNTSENIISATCCVCLRCFFSAINIRCCNYFFFLSTLI